MAPSLGNTLRVEREQRGLSLSDAAHETHIPVRRLQYLEDDNFAAFGSLTYARSFVRLYSQFLGVDASALLEKLPHGRLGGPAELNAPPERWVAASSRRTTATGIPVSGTPLHAGFAIFLLLLVSVGLWANHVAQQQALSDKAPPAYSLPHHQEISPPYKNFSAQLTLPESVEQKLPRSAPEGPKEIQKLFSERTGKRPSDGIQ